MTIREGEKIIYNSPKENLEKGEDPLHTFDLILNGQIIGRAEITYYSRPFPFYQVNELSVEHEYSGAGRAGEIMEQVESFLKKRRRAGVLVDGIIEGTPASGMYARRGWLEVPGGRGVFAYNLPRGAKPEDLRNYAELGTPLEERQNFDKEKWLGEEAKEGRN